MSTGELHQYGICDPIGVDVFTTRHEEYEIHVCGSGELCLGKMFSLPFLQKVKISLTPHKNSKYGAGQ